jgi:hypothetical protein
VDEMTIEVRIPEQRNLAVVINSGILVLISLMPFIAGVLFDEEMTFFCIVLSAIMAGMFLSVSVKHFNDTDLSTFLLIPLFLSAFQNVFLGIFIESLSSLEVQTLVVYNFIYSAVAVIVAALSNFKALGDPSVKRLIWLAGGILVFGAISLAIFGIEPRAFLSSFRNIISPIIFTMLGLLLALKVDIKRFLNGFCLIGAGVLAFGFYEYFVDPMLWNSLNVSELWDKKQIGHVINTQGLPRNFFSAERIDGEHLRRMASSFADPVNFGTVVFFIFSCAWLRGKWILMALSVLAALLAVSKGAIVGLLVFISVWSFFYLNRMSFLACFGTAISFGIGFIIYSLNHATSSLIVHVSGLVSALATLPSYPLGRGIGSVGVLGGLFSTRASEHPEIIESGLGVIVGQMGFLGISLYGFFFVTLFFQAKNIQDKRDKVFFLTILFAIILNIAFNEVALSPNSSAGYFLAMGLLISAFKTQEQSKTLAHRNETADSPLQSTT